MGASRAFTTFAAATDRVLLKLMWNKLARITHEWGTNAIHSAAIRSCPRIITWAYRIAGYVSAMQRLARPVLVASLCWAAWALLRHAIEPPPYEAPPGCYPNGGPMIEITQEEAPNREMVFTCPAPLARLVQERVMLCERDPTIIQKTKAIASKWCDNTGLTGNERYATIAGAVAAAMVVPINEQLVLQLASTHAVQLQHTRISRYLSGIKHQHDPWWTKYLSIRR